MPRVDATIDDELFAMLEEEARKEGCSKAELVRLCIQARFATPEPTPAAAGVASEEVRALTAKVDALAKYLCTTTPLHETYLQEEKEKTTKSWLKWKTWAKAIEEKGRKE